MINILTIIGSVLTGIIAAFVTIRNFDQNHKAKYVTEERRAWRQEIRDKMQEIAFTDDIYEIRKLYTFINVRINPYDKEDQAILENLKQLMKEPNVDKWQELQGRVALLLKHDWERVKKEVKIKKPISRYILCILILGGYGSYFYEKDYTIHCIIFGLLGIFCILLILHWRIKLLKKYPISYMINKFLTNHPNFNKEHPIYTKIIIDWFNIRNYILSTRIYSEKDKQFFETQSRKEPPK